MPIRKRPDEVVKNESNVKRRTMFQPMDHTINQTIDQTTTDNPTDNSTNDSTTNDSTNQPDNQSINQSVSQSSTNQPINQAIITQTNSLKAEEPLFDNAADIEELLMKQSMKQAIKPEFNPFDPSNRSLNRSVRPPIDISAIKPKIKSEPLIDQTNNQSDNQTINQSKNQSSVKLQIKDEQSFNSPIKGIINSDDELDEKEQSDQSDDHSNHQSDDDGPPALDMDDFFGQFMMKSEATTIQSKKPSTNQSVKLAATKQSTKKSKKKSPKKSNKQTSSEIKHCMPPITPDRHSKFQSIDQSNNQSLDELKSPDPTLLILGSCPSEASLLAQQYYAHKQNHFWPIIGRLFNISWLIDRPNNQTIDYQANIDCLIDCSVALWDSIASFQRVGSMDQSINQPIQNDVLGLIERYESIKMIGCNGATSYKMCIQSIKQSINQSNNQHIHLSPNPSNHQSMLLSINQRIIKIVQLPSSSPAHAMKDAVKQKADKWKTLLELD